VTPTTINDDDAKARRRGKKRKTASENEVSFSPQRLQG
jgi:hypothetical protein